VIGLVVHGTDNRLTLYSAPLKSLAGPLIPWQKICDVLTRRVRERPGTVTKILLKRSRKEPIAHHAQPMLLGGKLGGHKCAVTHTLCIARRVELH
jgi:hypothetical protein